jgi:hypothetical protein
MIINRFPLAIVLSSVLTLHCSSTKSLSEAEKAKLDLPLLHLLTGKPVEENRLDILTRSDGTKEYAIIIRSNHSEEIKEMGIAISSVFGDVIVARATIKELRKIVSLSSVRAIEVGSKNIIQPHQE